MKKQREILEKMKAGEKKAPSRFDESSLGLVVSSLDPSLASFYGALDKIGVPFNTEYDKKNNTLTLGSHKIYRQSKSENWCIEGRAGNFLRSYDAILQAIMLCYADILHKEIF